MGIKVKRAYDKTENDDGTRVLVDRLWPRGVTKKKAEIDTWAREVGPENDLRKWFHEDPSGRLLEFTRKYSDYLKKNEEAKTCLSELRKLKSSLTLVTAVKDIDHSHIPTLVSFLKKK